MATIIAQSVINSVAYREVNYLYTLTYLKRLDVKNNKYLNDLYSL